jgi:hypothetical protein
VRPRDPFKKGGTEPTEEDIRRRTIELITGDHDQLAGPPIET